MTFGMALTLEVGNAPKATVLYVHCYIVMRSMIHAVTDPFAAKKSSGLKDAKRRKKDKWRERLELNCLDKGREMPCQSLVLFFLCVK